MKTIKELFVATIIFLIYSMIAVLIWKNTNIILLIFSGLIFVLIYLSIRLIFKSRKKKPKPKVLTIPILKDNSEPDIYIGFRTLFSENIDGGKEL